MVLMAFSQTELDALKSAYASGTLEVVYDGKRIRYDDGDALLKRIRVIEAEIAQATSAPRTMAVYTTFRRD
jgi:hypothetical protein